MASGVGQLYITFRVWYTSVIIMKSRKNLLEQLKSCPISVKTLFISLVNSWGLKTGTVDTYISRFLKYKETHLAQ